MATKPLKTLTFEGLNDTYTVPQVDATLAVTGGAADAKATGDSLKEKASASGMVDMAKSLVGGKYTSDKQPYHFRKSPSGGAKDEVIVGGSLVWNQLCNGSSVTVQSGHKYLAKISGTFSIGASDGTAITGLTSGTDMVIDLTTLFGPTIADYIYSLETATAGAGIAWVKRYIDLYTYHEYDAGSIQSVGGLVSHDVVGKNLFDSSQMKDQAAWNLIELTVPANTQYTMSSNSSSSGLLCYFNNTGVSGGSSANLVTNTHPVTITSTAEGHAYVAQRIASGTDSFTNYNFQIELGSVATQYEPYEKHSYPLDSTITLRGVPKLVTDHIEFDGDKYRADGTVERRYGVVDLGTLMWNKANTPNNHWRFGATLSTVAKESSASDVFNGICTKYNSTSPSKTYDGETGISNNNATNTIFICDESFSDATTLKTAMSGVYLVYQLATPTTETAQPYQSPMIVGAAEEYVSDSVVPVGHESKYYEDVAKKVSGLPKDFSTLIAPTEVSYTATRNYSVGSYLIVNNQLYKVTSAISTGGTITPNSNVTATTIMAEIMALA